MDNLSFEVLWSRHDLLFGIVYFQVCPVCGKRVGMDLVGHITMQHGNFLKISFCKLALFIFFVFVLFSLHDTIHAHHAVVYSYGFGHLYEGNEKIYFV